MALTDADRRAIWADFQSEASSAFEGIAVSKPNLRAAVDAIDGWIGANVAGFNAAIPEPARSNLTARQKLRLFLYVVKRRWEVE